MSTGTSVVPQEIYDYIVDRVADVHGSIETLKDLCLTSRCFVRPTQSRLFWKVKLPPPDDIDAVDRMEELQLYPAVLACVRQLQVSLCYSWEEDWLDVEEYNVAVSRLVDDFPAQSLKRVFVGFTKDVGDNGDAMVARWSVISPTCKATLHSLRFNHSLDVISLHNILDVPLSSFLLHPTGTPQHVEFEKHSNVAIDLARRGTSRQHDPDAGVEYCFLQISFRRTGLRALPYLLPYFNGLSHLALEITDLQGHRAAWEMFATSELPMLNSLTIHYSIRITNEFCNDELVSQALHEMAHNRHNLPSLPRLRYLQVLLNAGMDRSDAECRHAMPSFIPTFLSAMISSHPQSSLEMLDFTAQWNMELNAQSFADATPLINRSRGWKELDHILSSRDLFPSLRVIRAICTPQINRSRRHYREPTPHHSVPLQIQQEVAIALQQARNTVAIVDVGDDKIVSGRAQELMDGIAPEGYAPNGRFLKKR